SGGPAGPGLALLGGGGSLPRGGWSGGGERVPPRRRDGPGPGGGGEKPPDTWAGAGTTPHRGAAKYLVAGWARTQVWWCVVGRGEAGGLVGAAAGPDREAGFAAVVALRGLVEVLEEVQVDNARAQGWSWRDIARRLGVTKQAVHYKHALRFRGR